MAKIGEGEALEIIRGVLQERRSSGARSARSAGRKGRAPQKGVLVGIGDDASVLRSQKGRQVWTVDACLEGVHFLRTWMPPEDVGYKALHSAVSDVAAMGARPTGALCQITLAPWMNRRDLRRFAQGQAEAAAELSCPIVGGNITGGECLECVTTALGQMAAGKEPLLRSGALPGDELWLLGDVGLARLGYLCLEQGARLQGHARVCGLAFRRPRALVQEGQRLLGRAHAALDLSDGLLRDTPRMADASGARLIIDADSLLKTARRELQVVARRLGESPLEVMVHGGEDYALLAAGPARRRPRSARRIGRVERGEGAFLFLAGKLEELSGGFEH